MSTAFHLAFREIWRHRGRFLLFSLVIALITVLVLFIAALGEGLGAGNREYIQKLDGDLLLYQDTAQLSLSASHLDRSLATLVRNIAGVQDAGAVSFASAAIMVPGADALDISLVGVQPGAPGEPPAASGANLERRSGDEALVDATVAEVAGLHPGDHFTLRTAQGNKEEFYTLQVVGVTDSRKYSLRPSIFVPTATFDQLQPGAGDASSSANTANAIVVRLDDPTQTAAMAQRLEAEVARVQAVDRVTAYQSTPGYTEQQSTLTTQNTFALLIGVLVIGGFFQIQTLQKVAQIGMLKAVGTPNRVIALAALLQIVAITVLGVAIGSLATFGLSLSFPANIPIVFDLRSGAMAVASILLIGPAGGLVSIRHALRVEPLTALGLSN